MGCWALTSKQGVEGSSPSGRILIQGGTGDFGRGEIAVINSVAVDNLKVHYGDTTLKTSKSGPQGGSWRMLSPSFMSTPSVFSTSTSFHANRLGCLIR